MSELEPDTSKINEPDNETIGESADKPLDQPRLPPGLRERVRKFFNDMQRGPVTKRAMAQDRTRSLTLLIGGTVGAVLLFLGVFSTPPAPATRESAGRGAPNLGRLASRDESATASPASVIPLLTADVASNDGNSDQLSPADIEGTSRWSSPDEGVSSGDSKTRIPSVPSVSKQPARKSGVATSSTAVSDPLATYRLNSAMGAPTYSYGGPATTPSRIEPLPISNDTAPPGTLAATRPDGTSTAKSSIIFVRSQISSDPLTKSTAPVDAPMERRSLLPPGTRLVARLEAAATTAVKTPVIASVEYNYERDGIIVVPAGAKVLGELQQASAQGFMSVRFHTLQMPNGSEEEIDGTAMSLDQKPLKGEVSGKNTGKKFVSRALSGVGTVAAYVVGAGDAGLNRTITGETLLRDRLASNIAVAGEQELTNAAYSENIHVTLPANTRLYVVLQKPAVNRPAPPDARNLDMQRPTVDIPSVQELRELMDLRREINRMYQESNNAGSLGIKP